MRGSGWRKCGIGEEAGAREVTGRVGGGGEEGGGEEDERLGKEGSGVEGMSSAK